MPVKKKIFTINFLILLAFIADRLIKFVFIQNPNFVWDFVLGILSFRLAKNYGIAFSLLGGFELGWIWLIIIAIVVVIIFILTRLLILAYQESGRQILKITYLTLILVGAFSNLLDRLRYGFVVDYIDVPFFTVFNLADTMITIGVTLVFVSEFMIKNKK